MRGVGGKEGVGWVSNNLVGRRGFDPETYNSENCLPSGEEAKSKDANCCYYHRNAGVQCPVFRKCSYQY